MSSDEPRLATVEYRALGGLDFDRRDRDPESNLPVIFDGGRRKSAIYEWGGL